VENEEWEEKEVREGLRGMDKHPSIERQDTYYGGTRWNLCIA
jgi:hypothetical protein